MKRIFSVFLILLLLGSIFSLSGCKREKQADLSDGIFLEYNKSLSKINGTTVENKAGKWSIVIHACTSKNDLSSRRRYFENTLTSIANTDIVSEEKTFGTLKFQTEYHSAGEKFAGSYFTQLETPVQTGDILHPLYGIYCYVAAVDNSYIEEIESVMQGLSVKDLV